MPSEETLQIVLVTGANRGIGQAVVAGLARARMTVFLCAPNADAVHDAATTLRADGLDIRDMQLDVTDSESITGAAAHVQQDGGRLDVLVNNVGIAGDRGRNTPGSADVDAIRKVLETNIFGVIAVTEAMLPPLRRSTHVRVVSGVGSLTLMSDRDHCFAGLVARSATRCRRPRSTRSPLSTRKHSAPKGSSSTPPTPAPSPPPP
jgi:NAD(P)-dependent dehydrogenase (short-subunit alcohol dehydrogenase family)